MGGVLLVLFVVVPIAEIAVIIEVGRGIGVLWTVGLLLLSAVVGSWLLRREGRRSWRAFSQALAEARVPTREVADGVLVIFGAALMIAPGFLTDLTGMLCLLPPSRAMLRRLLLTRAVRRLVLGSAMSRVGAWSARGPAGSPSRSGDPRRSGATRLRPADVSRGEVIEGEIIEGEAQP